MANFYYVKEGGTATGDAGRVATTKSTGSFATKGAANYYDDIDDALGATTAPAAGDYILVSNASTNTYSTVITFSIPDGVQVMSVDDSNCDQYAAGAVVDNTSAGADDEIILDSTADGWCVFRGIDFTSDEGVFFAVDQAYSTVVEDSTITKNHASGSLLAIGSGSGSQRSGKVYLKNVVIDGTHGSNNLSINVDLEAENLSGAVGHTLNSQIFSIQNSLGATNITCRNSDLTSIGTTSATVLYVVNADNGQHHLERCKIGASQSINSTIPNGVVDIWANSCDVGDGYFYNYHANFFGQIETDTTTYISGTTYDGTNGFSMQVDTTAEASVGLPYRYKLAEFNNQDLTTSKTVTVEATSATASLDTADWWIEIRRNDNTDEALGVMQTSQSSTGIEPGDGAAHTTTGTSTWTSGGGNDYIETVVIPALSNVDNGNVEVWVCVAKPLLTINFDMPSIA